MQQICLNNATHFAHNNHHKQKLLMECDVHKKKPRIETLALEKRRSSFSYKRRKQTFQGTMECDVPQKFAKP
jgi:hypothetical protein